jgi:hypothetical protein
MSYPAVIESIEQVLDMARRFYDIQTQLSYVRKVDESAEETVRRLIRERVGVATLLQDLGERVPNSFDTTFKDDLVERLRRWFEPALSAIKEAEEAMKR